ncbi:MAG: hypothetical protein U0768_19110 [Anaerolineae bacterium]
MINSLRRVWIPLACFAAGLLVGWLLLGASSPLRDGARPTDLAPNYLQDYLQLVADSYAQSRNLALAKLRLEGLDPTTVQRTLNDLAQQAQQLNLAPQADRARGLARALADSAVVPTPGAVATAAAVRTPAPTPAANVAADVGIAAAISRSRTALTASATILGLFVLAAILFWAYRHWRLGGRLWRRGARSPAGASAQEPLPPAGRRGGMRPPPATYIALDSPVEMRYSADIPDFRQDLRIVDGMRRGIGTVALHVSEIPPRDPNTGAPTGLELSLYEISDRTKKAILVSATAARDPVTAELVGRLENDWYKPAVNVEAMGQPLIMETAHLRLTTQAVSYDFRPGKLNPTFRTLVLSVVVTAHQGGPPPQPDADDAPADASAGDTAPVHPPGMP